MLFKEVSKPPSKYANIKTFKLFPLWAEIWLDSIFTKLLQNMEKELNAIWELKITL